jgi:hypothetical protein
MRWLVTAMHIELEPLTSREGVIVITGRSGGSFTTMNSCPFVVRCAGEQSDEVSFPPPCPRSSSELGLEDLCDRIAANTIN